MRLAEHARTPIGAQAGCGLQTQAGPALEPHAAETGNRGIEVCNVHASEREKHGAVARHRGASVTERGPQSAVRGARQVTSSRDRSPGLAEQTSRHHS